MKMTTGTGTFCPHCKKEQTITTSGIFGGIIKQMFMQAIFDRIKKGGVTVTCQHCKKEWKS